MGETANGTPTNLASRVAKVWAVRIRHEPVTRDRAPAGFYNPCGIVRNETADFRFSLEPAAFPASNVVWSVDATNRAEFVGEATGRSVVVRGKAPGPVKLTVGIKGYAGPPPVFEAGVVDRRQVRIKAFAVDEEDGGPVCGTNYVASLLPVANEIFSQVGIGFVLDPELGRVACTNYLVIGMETGDYPRGRALVDLNHETNAVEVYFVRTIEAADGLTLPGGVILPAGVGGHALAHELGHACGLGDVLDFVKWKDPVLNEEHGVLYPGETARIHLPHDWGTDVAEGYYDVQCHSNLLTRLLMCGRRLTPPTNEDITYGDADGLVFVSDSSPPYEATCRIGFFTVPGHVPSTD